MRVLSSQQKKRSVRLRAVISVISICSQILILMLVVSSAIASVDAPFIEHLNQTIPEALDEKSSGISDPALNKLAHNVWQEVISKGYALRKGNGADKEIGTIFRQLQAHIESTFINNLQPNSFGKAILIIHTPAIATPLVTQGELIPDLASAEILADQDKTRIKTALSRAKLMRDFLAKGGIIIATYEEKNDKKRTQAQIDIFKALKKQYPTQLIEFPLAHLPQEMIGATYLIEIPTGDVFEMTNHGVQINDTGSALTWGIWLQTRNQKHTQVNSRLCTVFHYLFANGLQDIIAQQAKAQGIAPKKYLALMERYLPDSDHLTTPCK